MEQSLNNPLISLKTLVEIIILLGSIPGAVIALIKWHESIKVKRAEFLYQLNEKLRTDNEIVETCQKLDLFTGKIWYNSEFYDDMTVNGLAGKTDKTLGYFSYVCYLRKTNLLSEKEFSFFSYRIVRFACDISFCTYMWNLYHFAKSQNTTMSFEYLIKYCIKKKLFAKDFRDKNCLKYDKLLNF